jgi:hypothetical protein
VSDLRSARANNGVFAQRLQVAVLAGAFLIVMQVVGNASIAQAHCVSDDNLRTLDKREDQFKNFDFRSYNVDRCSIDWPADFVFYNQASVPRVKNDMAQVDYDNDGDTMYGKLDNGNGWNWDTDPGRKNWSVETCYGTQKHFRLYGDFGPSNSMYNQEWGYWVLGTAHLDWHECMSDAKHGWSEAAEDAIAQDAANAPGIGLVVTDVYTFFNHLDLYYNGDGHVEQNSGAATAVRVNN